MNTRLDIIITICILLHLAKPSTSAVKVWNGYWDIRDPENWLTRKYGADCAGLVLGSDVYTSYILRDMKIKSLSISYSWTDTYLLNGATIEFTENTTDVLNCVQVEHIPEHHMFGTVYQPWMDPLYWTTEGEEGNVAIPNAERIPCVYDQVEFPKDWSSMPCYLGYRDIKIASIKFGDTYLTNDDLKALDASSISIFSSTGGLDITGEYCEESDGCLCQPDTDYNLCGPVDPEDARLCSEPVTPIGHCMPICGAVITLKPQKHFVLAFLRHYLKGFKSHTYASKVKNGTETMVQIVFAESNFTGISLDEAHQCYSKLTAVNLQDDIFKVNDVRILSSSRLFSEGEMASNALSIVFGTLCGVIVVFAVLFFVYSSQFSALNLRDRLYLVIKNHYTKTPKIYLRERKPRSTGSSKQVGRKRMIFADIAYKCACWEHATFSGTERFSARPLAPFSTNYFAKYDASEQTGLILKTQSPAGSVVSLDKSFDNPMYGRSTPSSASTSYDTMTHGEGVTKSEISHENPMYDFNNMGRSVEEEGELVDLTRKEE